MYKNMLKTGSDLSSASLRKVWSKLTNILAELDSLGAEDNTVVSNRWSVVHHIIMQKSCSHSYTH